MAANVPADTVEHGRILEEADEALHEAAIMRERVNASLRRVLFRLERRHPNRTIEPTPRERRNSGT